MSGRKDVPVNGSIPIVDTTTGRKGFSIQNVGPVDIYYSDDQRELDRVNPATGIPLSGHLLAAATPPTPPVVYPWMYGKKIYVRAQSSGGQVETLIYDVDKC